MYHALIRTHHITSRKKVTSLKAAAKRLNVYALLRSGGVPGVMYIRGVNKVEVQSWVDLVHDLRYKDYQLATPVTQTPESMTNTKAGVIEEVETVKEMGAKMDQAGLTSWWRKAMGFVAE